MGEMTGEMTGRICEGYVRDFQNPSHAESPLYKGVPEENVRDEAEMSHHMVQT